jgi:ActR/RegA family two-component response regulator
VRTPPTRPTVIVVNPDALELGAQIAALHQKGWTVGGTTSFEGAREMMTSIAPDVVITTVRLGRYNGLHLAILARLKHDALATIVVGEADPALEVEAESAGAQYLIAPVSTAVLLGLVSRLIQPSPTRKTRRIRLLRAVPVTAGGARGHLVDVSYVGARLYLHEPSGGLPTPLPVEIGELGIHLTGTPAWTQAAAESGIDCGVVWRTTVGPMAARWRDLVDKARRGAQAGPTGVVTRRTLT